MPLPASQIHETMQYAAWHTYPNGSVHAGLYTLVFRIRRLTDMAIVKEHRLILMPSRMQQSTEARTALYYTKAGPVADTPQLTGVGMTHFSIAGHTGFWGISPPVASPNAGMTPAAFAATVQQAFTDVLSGAGPVPRTTLIDGAAAIKDLRDTILAYFFPSGHPETQDVTATSELQLEFLNLTAPTSQQDQVGQVGWIIHPQRNLVDLTQDARQPFLYQYTLQFSALRSTTQDIPDRYVEELTDPKTGLRRVFKQITETVQSVTNGINTIADAFQQLVSQNLTGPISTFLGEATRLGDAVGAFMDGASAKLLFPLYAARTLQHALDAPAHSVTTLAAAATQLGQFLIDASDPRSLSKLLPGVNLLAGTNDALTVQLNREAPVTLALGSHSSGASVAAAIQAQVRAQAPQHAANASAYRDFTATYDGTRYRLAAGTTGSDAGSVTIVSDPDTDLVPNDASRELGLGLLNGGQEHAGTDYANAALALLRGVEQACLHLQGFPDYFADQLEQQDAVLAALLPPEIQRPQLTGDQYLRQTRITPGDSLQGIAARVGVPWETLALVNRLTYPFLLEAPTELTRGRLSSATPWAVTDTTQAWPLDAWQGQRLDLLAGPGQGQSRRIVRNDATTLVLETAWSVTPNDTTDYAICQATNPIQRTGQVASTSARTLTDTTQTCVPGSQTGLTVLVTSGAVAGERRTVLTNDATTLTLAQPWTVPPEPGARYLLLGPELTARRQRLVGEWLSVPMPSAQARLPLRTRLHDVSAMTGQQRTMEERLFGRDLRLVDGCLVYDPGLTDVQTIAALENLRQAVIHYCNLPIGELEYQPNLGSYIAETIGLTATLPLQIELLESVHRTIRQDRRIAAMTEAVLRTQGGVSVLSFAARAINGSTIDRISVR